MKFALHLILRSQKRNINICIANYAQHLPSYIFIIIHGDCKDETRTTIPKLYNFHTKYIISPYKALGALGAIGRGK